MTRKRAPPSFRTLPMSKTQSMTVQYSCLSVELSVAMLNLLSCLLYPLPYILYGLHAHIRRGTTVNAERTSRRYITVHVMHYAVHVRSARNMRCAVACCMSHLHMDV